ncbi:hypothetical protein [Marinitoga sp. 1135]|uniref:hypothetical protein n=1 Tax=Marinitoga sp. 1135 TaxID=1643333 RepID=UPI0015860935|nr:hypothetical protein [Marinitoga sp. 1135]
MNYTDYNYYVLNFKNKNFPIPFDNHKIDMFGKVAVCNKNRKSIFEYSEVIYKISSNISQNNKTVFFSGVENEIILSIKFNTIKKSDDILPVFCVLSKNNSIYNGYFNLISPDFNKRNKELLFIFKQNTENFIGFYDIDFYVAGYEIFSSSIEFKKHTYSFHKGV